MQAVFYNYTATLASNVSLINQFVSVSAYSSSGSFGLKLATDQAPSEAPKFLGFHQYLDEHRTCVTTPAVTCPSNCNGNGDCVAGITYASEYWSSSSSSWCHCLAPVLVDASGFDQQSCERFCIRGRL